MQSTTPVDCENFYESSIAIEGYYRKTDYI